MSLRRTTSAALVLLAGCATPPPPGSETLQQQVLETERAFARTMADRDHAAFTAYLAEEAVFFAGDRPIRGGEAIAAEWRPYFEEAAAPFSWEPDQVEVLESGALAWSTGPVRDAQGNRVGRFNSVWRRAPSGEWRIVFDRGSPVCPPPAGGG